MLITKKAFQAVFLPAEPLYTDNNSAILTAVLGQLRIGIVVS